MPEHAISEISLSAIIPRIAVPIGEHPSDRSIPFREIANISAQKPVVVFVDTSHSVIRRTLGVLSQTGLMEEMDPRTPAILPQMDRHKSEETRTTGRNIFAYLQILL